MNCPHRSLAGALLLGGVHFAAHPLLATATIAPPLCTAGMLRVTASMQRAGGSSFGAVAFTNTGNRVCILRGRIGVRLLDTRGRQLSVQYVYRRGDLYGRRTPPYVELTPHFPGGGYVQLLWRNWCGARLTAVRITVMLPNGRGSVMAGRTRTGRVAVPSCSSPRTRSTVSIGPPELVHF